MQPVVVKLGGSALSQPQWPQQLIAYLERQRISNCLLVVGGGAAIDAMRDLDAVHHLDAAQMHWRCVGMLTSTAEVACELLRRESSCYRVEGPLGYSDYSCPAEDVTPIDCPVIRVIRVDSWYCPAAAEHERLPSDWRTTTDAIAIWIAAMIAADRCVILKSCHVPKCGLADLAAMGIVDEATSMIARMYSAVEVVQLPE